jgi:hypothetical protein
MPNHKGSSGEPLRLLLLLGATLSALVLLYAVTRTALAGLNPVAAAELPPRGHSRLLRLQLYDTLVTNRRVSRDLISRVRPTVLAEPLSFEPFFLRARAAGEAGKLSQAIQLMEEARRRRPNFVPTRFALADFYTRAGRLKEAFGELFVSLRLVPQAVHPVMVELTKLVSTRNGRSVLAEALVNEPSWRSSFFAVARTQSISPADANALLREVEARQPGGAHTFERQLLIGSLVKAGEVSRARALWLNALPPGERRRHLLITNSGFGGKPAGEPFGWTVSETSAGRAEIIGADTPNPHLNVEYFGGNNAVLAEQLLALPAGAYRLQFDVAGESGSRTPSIYWSIACSSGAPALVRVQMSALTTSYKRREAAFRVPASGCDGQHLRLVAEAGEIPATSNVKIAALEIRR